MLTGQFSSDNAFMVADTKRPTQSEPNYILNVAVRDYGQISISLPPNLLTQAQIIDLEDGELGYPLSDYLGTGITVTGNFTRYRRSPTSAVSLQFVVTQLQ